MGECRRYAPRPTNDPDTSQFVFWPEVNREDWCGEWEVVIRRPPE